MEIQLGKNLVVEGFQWKNGWVIKSCLHKVLSKAKLALYDIRTSLIEMDGTLNNRQITYMYDDLHI